MEEQMKQLQDQGFLLLSNRASRVDVDDLDSPSFSKPLECTDFTVNQGPKWSEEDAPSQLEPPDDDVDVMLGKKNWDRKTWKDCRCSVLKCPPCHVQLFCQKPPRKVERESSLRFSIDLKSLPVTWSDLEISGNTYPFTSFSCSFEVGPVTCINEVLWVTATPAWLRLV